MTRVALDPESAISRANRLVSNSILLGGSESRSSALLYSSDRLQFRLGEFVEGSWQAVFVPNQPVRKCNGVISNGMQTIKVMIACENSKCRWKLLAHDTSAMWQLIPRLSNALSNQSLSTAFDFAGIKFGNGRCIDQSLRPWFRKLQRKLILKFCQFLFCKFHFGLAMPQFVTGT